MNQNQMADDLKFIRSMAERTQRQIDPRAPIIITWGVICLLGYPASQWLAIHQYFEQISWLWLGLGLLGAVLSMFFAHQIHKQEINRGVKSYISKQIALVWIILVSNGIVWTLLGIFHNPHQSPGPGFIWAALYGIGLSMMGILYSKEWFISGIAIFIAIVFATFARPYASIILGITMGLGCIIPGVIAQQRLRQWEKKNV